MAYGEYVDTARDLIRDAAKGCPGVLTDNKLFPIFAQEFADSSINLDATRWTRCSALGVRQSRDAAVAAIKNALDEAGIEIPSPYRTLTFRDPVLVRVASADQ